MPFVAAHAGHWLVSLLYVGPVAVIVAVLWAQSVRDKRRQERDGG